MSGAARRGESPINFRRRHLNAAHQHARLRYLRVHGGEISAHRKQEGLRSFPRSPHTGGNLSSLGENWKTISLIVEHRRILPIGLLC